MDNRVNGTFKEQSSRGLIGHVMVLLMMMLLVALPMYALAAQITIDVSGQTSGVPFSGLKYEIFKVGSWDSATSGWKMDGNFANVKMPTVDSQNETDPAEVKAAIQNIEKIISDRKLTATQTGTLNSSGVAVFQNIPVGVYYGRMVDVPEYLEVDAFLTSVISTQTVKPKVDVPTTKVEGTKVWRDAKNKTGRPSSITVVLYADDDKVAEKQVASQNGDTWSFTFDDLPVYRNGKKATYTVGEISVPGYETAVSGTTITNTLLTDIPVSKVWYDNGSRPSSITIILSANGTETRRQTLYANSYTGNTWSYTFEGLPVYGTDGKEISYTVTEAVTTNGSASTPAGYEMAISGSVDDGFTITNTLLRDVSGTKTWQDNDNAVGVRPSAVTVTLYANGVEVDATPVWNTSTGNSNQWTYTFANLPAYDTNGRQITYTVREGTVRYYTATISGLNITNRLTSTPTPTPVATPTPTPEPTPTPTTSLRGMKVWVDDNDAHKVRPASITITLYADGTPVSATPVWTYGTNAWSYVYEELPLVNEAGATIQYTVSEAAVENYESSVAGTTITNTLIPKEPSGYTDISGHKTWREVPVESATLGQVRVPDSITVTLLRNGEAIDTREVSASTNWDYLFANQPLDDGYGTAYTYTVRESGVSGYLVTVDGYNLINTPLYTPNGRIPDRTTPTGERPKTPASPYVEQTEEELEELIDIFDYETPLYGGLLKTGDEVPVYPFIFGGIGVAIIVLLIVAGKRRKPEGRS